MHRHVGFPLLILVAGCTSPSEMLVGPSNNMVRCASSGWGFIGAPVAHHMFSNCVDDYKAVGYLPLEEAGLIGVQLSEGLVVAVVTTPSPAASAGIQTGDHLVQVNGQPVVDRPTALKMMFGKQGEAVVLTFQRHEQTLVYRVIRAPRQS